MRETTLKAIAVSCSLLGLVIVYTISVTPLSPTPINALSISDSGKQAKVCGEVEAKRVSKGHIFFSLSDGYGTINVVIFNTTASKLVKTGLDIYGVKNGDYSCATGRLSEYPKGSGRLEIVYSQ